jgi:amino acid adenylation domain-containing protein
MLGHLVTLLEGIATAPNLPLRDLRIMTAAEHRVLIEEWNPPIAPHSEGPTLIELFEAQVAREPGRAALEFESQRLTYGELNAAANSVAHGLRSAGVTSGTLVALCADRSIEMVVGLLGILKAGAAYLPIDLAVPTERIQFIFADSDVPVVLTQRNLLSRVPSGKRTVMAVEDLMSGGRTDNPAAEATGDSLAYVIYTSGSTGKPKGVLVTHANVARLFTATEGWFRFGASDVWTLFHSYAFDFSVWEIWGALLYGGRLVVVPYLASRSPEAFLELLAQTGVTVLNQTPSAFHQLMRADEMLGTPRLSLRWVIFGGEALDPASLTSRRGDVEPRLVNMYGITETTVHVTYRSLSTDDVSRGSVIGVPITDMQAYVLDAHRRPVPIGVPGELYVGGPGVARGYLKRPELTAERFIPHPFRPGERLYRTGDQVRWLVGRDLEYLGRLDFQVKVRGYRIELGEIEAVLTSYPGIAGATALVREDSPGDRRIVAYFVAQAGLRPAVSALRAQARAVLPDYMVPAAFVELPEFPLTSNGKLDRDALPAPDEAEEADMMVAPRTPLEEAVAGIFLGVLGRARVGVTTSFFEMGGHSLLATQVVGRASRLFRVKLPLRDFFEEPTVAGFAETLIRHEQRPGQVDQIARLLLSIDAMPEAERSALRTQGAVPAPPGSRP